MACWSAENATNAYLRTMKMGKSAEEPNGSEFISALAAGNNAQFMVVACSGAADSTAVALLAAAHQTGGRLVCILRGHDELRSSQTQTSLGNTAASNVEFVVGDARVLLQERYKESDFIAIDCNLENSEEMISGVQEKEKGIVVGYNAFCTEKWRNSPLRTQLLPIGEGLLVTRVAAKKRRSKSSNWIVKVDKCTGEEHVYRVRSSVPRIIRA